MKEERLEYPPEKAEAFLSVCFEQEIAVFCNERVYRPGNPYINHRAVVKLPDGEELSFSVWWEKSASTVDGGLYTNYGEKLLEYYTEKYGLVYRGNDYRPDIFVPEDVEENESGLEQCLKELWNSGYIQSGQELDLALSSEKCYSYDITLSREEELPYDTIIRKLSTGR
ncbi:MAG: hypothetical protein NC348_07845 [Clostridium sp.]|nr:hypothetical protein [Clostridium sp.]